MPRFTNNYDGSLHDEKTNGIISDAEGDAGSLSDAVAKVVETPAGALASILPASVTGGAEDFAVRVTGARQSYLPRGRVTEDMLKASLAQARERSPLPAAVKLPWWRWSPLLLTGLLERAAGAGESPPR